MMQATEQIIKSVRVLPINGKSECAFVLESQTIDFYTHKKECPYQFSK